MFFFEFLSEAVEEMRSEKAADFDFRFDEMSMGGCDFQVGQCDFWKLSFRV